MHRARVVDDELHIGVELAALSDRLEDVGLAGASSAAVECVISSRFLVMIPECENGCGGVTAASTAAISPPLPGLRMMSPFLAFMKRGGSMT